MTTIDAATARDIPAIMRLERGDGFEHLVGRWSAEQHAAEMALPGSHYLAARRGDAIDDFVMLQQLDDSNGCGVLRRIAVARPDEGLGSVLLDAALAHAFGATSAHRLELRVYPENERGWRAYGRAAGESHLEMGLTDWGLCGGLVMDSTAWRDARAMGGRLGSVCCLLGRFGRPANRQCRAA